MNNWKILSTVAFLGALIGCEGVIFHEQANLENKIQVLEKLDQGSDAALDETTFCELDSDCQAISTELFCAANKTCQPLGSCVSHMDCTLQTERELLYPTLRCLGDFFCAQNTCQYICRVSCDEDFSCEEDRFQNLGLGSFCSGTEEGGVCRPSSFCESDQDCKAQKAQGLLVWDETQSGDFYCIDKTCIFSEQRACTHHQECYSEDLTRHADWCQPIENALDSESGQCRPTGYCLDTEDCQFQANQGLIFPTLRCLGTFSCNLQNRCEYRCQ